MDFTTVENQLNDLPRTFKRPDQTYLQVVDSFALALYLFTQASDGTSQQLQFPGAQYGWLDVWGLLFGIPRFSNEADQVYAARIAFQVLAGGGPAQQIVNWIQIVYRITVSVVENLPAVGYSIIFPGGVTTAQIQTILAALGYTRPAGVPITSVFSYGAGTILDTINFMNAPDVVGAYLTGGATAVPFSVPATTNNAVPLLPSLFLTDPSLNGLT